MKVIFLLLLCAAGLAGQDRLDWYRKAKFGLFVHWGPYTRLAGEWKGRRVPLDQNAEWIMHDFRIPVREYREEARRFNPARFDARAWARMAARAGMKYLVVTAKHHDGFAMYKSAVSPYNIVDWTPFGRDPLAELAQACREEGIRFCVYYSHREDWDDPDAYGNTWDFAEEKKNFERYLEKKSKPQVRELLTGYGPLGLIWFDRGLYTPEQAREFTSLVHSLQPQCLVNGRVGNYDQDLMGDYQVMEDNGMPPGGLDEYWETAQTLNGTWGYSKFDHHWKSPRTVVRRLVDTASKGGNYLLDLGPDPEGVFPAAGAAVLEEVGKWMARNGESVYGTSASPFAQLPWGAATVKGERLYLHVFDWPAAGLLRVPGLRNAPKNAWLLSAPGRKLAVSRQGSGVTIQLPPSAPDALDSVVVLDVEGRPVTEPFLVMQPPRGPLRLDYMYAVTRGGAAKRFNRKGGYHIARWTSPGDSASWRVRIAKPGRFRVRLTFAARPESEGSEFVLCGEALRPLRGKVQATPDWFEYRSTDLGELEIRSAGEWELSLRPAAPLDHNLMYFQSLELEAEPRPGDVQ